MELSPVGALQQSKSVAMPTFRAPEETMTQFGRICTETGSAPLHLKGQENQISRSREAFRHNNRLY